MRRWFAASSQCIGRLSTDCACRVQREEESGIADGRHGHPVKLRGEVLTCLIEHCRANPCVSSSTVQRLLQERFGVSISVSQLNRVRARLGLTRKPVPREKKPQTGVIIAPGSHEQAGGLRMPGSSYRDWAPDTVGAGVATSPGPTGAAVPSPGRQCSGASALAADLAVVFELSDCNAHGICVAIPPMVWPCSPDEHVPMAIATQKPFCRRWLTPMEQNASRMPLHPGPPFSGMYQEKIRKEPNACTR